jgi:peptide/nickel transport system permease protein
MADSIRDDLQGGNAESLEGLAKAGGPSSLTQSSLLATELEHPQPEIAEEDEYAVAVEQLTQFEMIWRRFRHHRLALVALVVFVLLILMAIIAPLITRMGPTDFNPAVGDVPPSFANFPNLIMGTDTLGHSIWSDVAYGARVSLTIGVVAALGASLIGTIVGAVSGYYGGWVDMVLMRLTDVVLSIPFLPLLITLSAFFIHGNVWFIIVIFVVLTWPQPARLVRSYYLTFREQEFTEAAKAAGIPDARIIFRHILPNALSPIIVITTLNVASFIVLEATVDFLGLGVTFPPTATWGNILDNAQNELLAGNWWWATFPGLFLLLTVLTINFVGDGLRDALDVRMKD